MSTHKEALTLALECAERCESIDGMYSWTDTVTAIKEVLAQPAVAEQHKQMSVSEVEPVAWMEGESVYWHTNPSLNDWIRANGTPLYITPPQRTWVRLTEEEVIDLWPDLIMHRHTYQFWQNLEAKLKEKNT